VVKCKRSQQVLQGDGFCAATHYTGAPSPDLRVCLPALPFSGVYFHGVAARCDLQLLQVLHSFGQHRAHNIVSIAMNAQQAILCLPPQCGSQVWPQAQPAAAAGASWHRRPDALGSTELTT